MRIIEKIKSIFKKKKKYPLPQVFGLIEWNEYSKRFGVGGDINKQIVIYEYGRPSMFYPYSEEIAESIINILKIPIFDFTKESVKFDVFDEYNPAVIHVRW